MKKIFTKTFRPGEKWSGAIGRHKYLHFKALGEDANLSILMYNLLDTSERYNMPDTLKAQYTSHLTKGNVLMSDNGTCSRASRKTASAGTIRSRGTRRAA